MQVAAPRSWTSTPPSPGPASCVAASEAEFRLLRLVNWSAGTIAGINVELPTSKITVAIPLIALTATSWATVRLPANATAGTDAIAHPRIRSMTTWVSRRGSRVTSTPAGRPSTSHGSCPAAAITATAKVEAWTTVSAVSGSATVVTAVPRLLIADPVQ